MASTTGKVLTQKLMATSTPASSKIGCATGKELTYFQVEKYIGEWKDNKYNGQGNNTNILGIGNAYFGEFRDGIFNGQGIYTITNGDKYVGEWKDGKINGLGIKYSSNGNVEKTGVFKDNVLTTSLYVDPNRFTRIDRSKNNTNGF